MESRTVKARDGDAAQLAKKVHDVLDHAQRR
jgi:hypothetical protein